jgi:hypothetical protein
VKFPRPTHLLPILENAFRRRKRPVGRSWRNPRTWVGALVRRYNHEQRHSAIQFATPAPRHANLDQAIHRRAALYETAR